MKAILKTVGAAALALAVLLGAGLALPVMAAGGTMEIATADASAKNGEEFTVDINVSNNPGLASLKVIVGFDAQVLEVISAEIDSRFAGLDNANFIALPGDGAVTFNWLRVFGECEGDGPFAHVTFRVADSARSGSYPLTLTVDPDDVMDEALEPVDFVTVEGAVTVAEHEHILVESGAVEPTCTEDGHAACLVCSICGLPFDENGEALTGDRLIPALGHDWDEGVVLREATTWEEGEILYTCRRDEAHQKTEAIPRLTAEEAAEAEAVRAGDDVTTDAAAAAGETAPGAAAAGSDEPSGEPPAGETEPPVSEETTPAEETALAADRQTEAAQTTALPWIIGGAALVVVIAAVVIILSVRRKKAR